VCVWHLCEEQRRGEGQCVRERAHALARQRVCMFVCVRSCVHLFVRVRVCVRVWDREREREVKEKERESAGENEGTCAYMCLVYPAHMTSSYIYEYMYARACMHTHTYMSIKIHTIIGVHMQRRSRVP